VAKPQVKKSLPIPWMVLRLVLTPFWAVTKSQRREVSNVLSETIIASCERFGLRTPGAFPHVRGEVRLEGVARPRTAVIGVPVTGAVAAGAVFTAVASVSGPRTRVNPAWVLGQKPFSQVDHVRKTVRKHNNYMTRVIANGGDAMGPHRRRVPV
jgi:hypothetical protein